MMTEPAFTLGCLRNTPGFGLLARLCSKLPRNNSRCHSRRSDFLMCEKRLAESWVAGQVPEAEIEVVAALNEPEGRVEISRVPQHALIGPEGDVKVVAEHVGVRSS